MSGLKAHNLWLMAAAQRGDVNLTVANDRGLSVGAPITILDPEESNRVRAIRFHPSGYGLVVSLDFPLVYDHAARAGVQPTEGAQ